MRTLFGSNKQILLATTVWLQVQGLEVHVKVLEIATQVQLNYKRRSAHSPISLPLPHFVTSCPHFVTSCPALGFQPLQSPSSITFQMHFCPTITDSLVSSYS